HHARGRARRASAPVLPLEQRDAQPAQRGIPRHAAAVDPSADDDQVVHELTPRALSRALRRGPALGLGTGGRSRRLGPRPAGLGSAAPAAPLGSGAARRESRPDASSPTSSAGAAGAEANAVEPSRGGAGADPRTRAARPEPSEAEPTPSRVFPSMEAVIMLATGRSPHRSRAMSRTLRLTGLVLALAGSFNETAGQSATARAELRRGMDAFVQGDTTGALRLL